MPSDEDGAAAPATFWLVFPKDGIGTVPIGVSPGLSLGMDGMAAAEEVEVNPVLEESEDREESTSKVWSNMSRVESKSLRKKIVFKQGN